MERIVRQEIPPAVIDNPDLLWDPVANTVRPLDPAEAVDPERLARAREPDTRYAHLLEVFHAARNLDPYSPASRPSSTAASSATARSRSRRSRRCWSRCSSRRRSGTWRR